MNPYRQATNYACDVVEKDVNSDGTLDFPESTFADSIFCFSEHIELKRKHALNRLHPNYEDSEVSYWAVQPFIGYYLYSLAKLDGVFFDYLAELCAQNILAQVTLHEPLNQFAQQILVGKITRPSKANRPRKKNWMEMCFLWSLTLELVDDYGLKLTRNDEGSNRSSACDAVAEALTVCGHKKTYFQMKNLMVHPDQAQRRKEFEVSRRIHNRWQNVDAPQNALAPEFSKFWFSAAEADVLDILATFSPPKEESR